MVPHSWVTESLNRMGIEKNVVSFFWRTMKSWKVELTWGAETLLEVSTKKGIFQGDVLSLLLFVIALISLTHLLRTANLVYEFRTGETINHLLFMDDLNSIPKVKGPRIPLSRQ